MANHGSCHISQVLPPVKWKNEGGTILWNLRKNQGWMIYSCLVFWYNKLIIWQEHKLTSALWSLSFPSLWSFFDPFSWLWWLLSLFPSWRCCFSLSLWSLLAWASGAFCPILPVAKYWLTFVSARLSDPKQTLLKLQLW